MTTYTMRNGVQGDFGGMHCTAVFSTCEKYRYSLGRFWDEDKPFAIFACLNPSTATHMQDDPTIRRITKFAKDWRFGGVYVLNLFALRSTDPGLLITQHEAGVNVVGPDNQFHVEAVVRDEFNRRNTMHNAILRQCAASMGTDLEVVCAWGTHGRFLNQDLKFCEWLYDSHATLSAFKINKDGTPKHPLYMKRDIIPEYWPGEYSPVLLGRRQSSV